ncbi:MAG: competence/damage-inducible protein A [Anaerovoracaceae bacterium]
MKVAIISIGTELLFGQTIDTNAAFIAREMQGLGFDVMYKFTVGDNPKRMEETIREAKEKADIVITSGGLGPTQDDITKEVATEVFGDKLICNEEILEEMKGFFKKINREMTKNNEKQAYLPSRGTVFYNAVGTAPGFALKEKNLIKNSVENLEEKAIKTDSKNKVKITSDKYIICLPGPPREMMDMFENEAKPFLESLTDSVIFYKVVRTFGIGESAAETALLDLIDNQKETTIATYAKSNECTIRVTSKVKYSKDKEECSVNENDNKETTQVTNREEAKKIAEEKVNACIEQIKERIGEYIFSTDNETLAEVVINKLREKKITLSAAESCTGGVFASTITEVPGASDVFDRSIVTYSNFSKIQEIDVRSKTLNTFGAVSEEVAREMAEGIHTASSSDVCVSVTGVAGPGGGTEDKPVGTVWIAVHYQGHTKSKLLQLRNGSRNWIRSYAVMAMLDLILKDIS